MDSNNWNIFDQHNGTTIHSASSTPNDTLNHHSPGIQNSITAAQFNSESQFLSFDSPSNHSDISNGHHNHGNLNLQTHHQQPQSHHQQHPHQQSQHQHLTNTPEFKRNDYNEYAHANQHHHSHLQSQVNFSNQPQNNWNDFQELDDIEMNLNYYEQQNAPTHSEFHSHQNPTQDVSMVLSSQMDDGTKIININSKHANTQNVPPTPRSLEIVSSSLGNTNFNLMNQISSPAIEQHSQFASLGHHHLQQSAGINPESVFTPLISPAVTPLDSLASQHSKFSLNTQSIDAPSNKLYERKGSGFSPLSSPALIAKSPGRFKKSSSPEDSSTPNSSSSTASNSIKKPKRGKTPGSTPIVGPTIPGRIAKQSPIIKAKRSSSYATTISQLQQQQYQKQQQQHHQSPTVGFSDMNLPDPVDSMAPPKSSSSATTARRPRIKKTLSSTTPILAASTSVGPLPTLASASKNPQESSTTTKHKEPSPVTSLSPQITGSHPPATPATLMNFKLETSASSATSSPVILPSSSVPTQPISHRSSSVVRITPKSTPLLAPKQQSQSMGDEEDMDPSSKKASHKLAEQGRRNRMNKAIQDLSDALPEHLTSKVQIPSKATTVELAHLYILDLVAENSRLRDQLKRDHGDECSSNESISPLATNTLGHS